VEYSKNKIVQKAIPKRQVQLMLSHLHSNTLTYIVQKYDELNIQKLTFKVVCFVCLFEKEF
jgi:hypothetical protein